MNKLTPEEEASFNEFVNAFRADALGKLAESVFTISLVPGGEGLDSFDVKFAVELGASILLNKPVIAFCASGRPCPPGLRRVAHAVIELEYDIDTEAGQLEAQRRLAEVMIPLMEELKAAEENSL